MLNIYITIVSTNFFLQSDGGGYTSQASVSLFVHSFNPNITNGAEGIVIWKL